MANPLTTKTLAQTVADYRAERDRARREAELKAEQARQLRAWCEAETAKLAVTWLAREYHLSVPVEQISAEQDGDEYELVIWTPDRAGRVRLNGRVSWAGDSLTISSNYSHVGGQATWHASSHGSYIEAELLSALDFVYPWPSDEPQP